MTTLSIHQSHLGQFNSYTGRLIDFNHPAPEQIDLTDIAHALSNICRFGGHSGPFYSVAQHSILVAALAPPHLRREALMHDAAEAYLGDVIKPLKILLGDKYSDLEASFESVICDKFCLSWSKMTEVKPYDMQAVEIEHEALKLGQRFRFEKAFSIISQPLAVHCSRRLGGFAWGNTEAEVAFKCAYDYTFGSKDILANRITFTGL